MTPFIAIAGLLLVAVLATILYPLLKNSAKASEDASAKARELNLTVLREQRAELENDKARGALDPEAYGKALEELERRALEDVGDASQPASKKALQRPVVAIAVGLLLPVAALSLYFILGEPGGLDGNKQAQSQDGGHATSPRQIAAMVERLAARLEQNPGDGEGWLMLARSYSAMGRFVESATAYNRAASLLPPDAQLLADFADTVAMANGRRLQGEPELIVRRALEVDPNNVKALALAGTIAFDRQDYASAIGQWKKILALVPEESSVANGIRGSIQDAENRVAVLKKAGSTSSVAAAAAVVKGVVTLDPSLAAAAAPGDTLFVYARAVDGPKVPLAMLKKTVGDLPLQFALDDSMAMAPNYRLSQHQKVLIGARISKSGDALPRPGDLQGQSNVVTPGASGVKIVISSRVN